MEKRGQAAIDFLITYGWSFAIILIMIGAMAYLGFYEPPLPEHCVIEAGFLCPEYSFDETTGDFSISIFNGQGTRLVLDSFDVQAINTDCPALPPTTPLGAVVLDVNGHQIITFNCDATLLAKEIYEFEFQLSYREHLGVITQKVDGKLFVKIP